MPYSSNVSNEAGITPTNIMRTKYIKISDGQNEFLATEASVTANPLAKSDPKYCEHLDTPFASGFGYDDTSKYPKGIEIIGFVEIP